MPVAVIYGDEAYLANEAVKALRAKVVNPSMASLCHKILQSPSLAGVLEAVGSVSLALGGDTLIEIRDFSGLMNASKDAATDSQLEELQRLLADVEPTKTVLFANTKLDAKIRFSKWLLKLQGATIQKFEAFKFWETEKVVDFIVGYAKMHNARLNPQAANVLVLGLGTDLRTLTQEVDKLMLFALDREITVADVEKLSNHSENLFQIVDSWVLKRTQDETFAQLQEILLKRHPVELFSTIQSYFGNLFRAIWFYHQGDSPDQIAQKTGQKPFTVKKNLGTFSRVPGQRWLKLKDALLDYEWKVKTGQLEGQLALEMMLSE